MPMGEAGGAGMAEMEMPLPDNTLPMMTGFGQFGPIEMGGMFTVMKIRDDLERGNYKDPGWYKNPEGTVAHEWTGDAGKAAEAPPNNASTNTEIEVRVVKPTGPMNH
jgi:hypothetical protein